MFGGLGATEIMLIFLVVLLLFGAKKIPEIAKGMGKGIREFKSAINEVQDEIEMSVEKNSRPSSHVENKKEEPPVSKSEDKES